MEIKPIVCKSLPSTSDAVNVSPVGDYLVFLGFVNPQNVLNTSSKDGRIKLFNASLESMKKIDGANEEEKEKLNQIINAAIYI